VRPNEYLARNILASAKRDWVFVVFGNDVASKGKYVFVVNGKRIIEDPERLSVSFVD
jgi:hypothetical protein